MNRVFSVAVVFLFSVSYLFISVPATSDQIQTLLKLKSGIIDGFGRLSSWKSDSSDSADSADSPCSWDGIECDAGGTVVGIDIGSRNLSGTIENARDDFCAVLSNLTGFSVGDNAFTGNFPFFILGCRNLLSLELQRNLFTGALPGNLSLLSSLRHLDLSDALYTGSIPADLGRLQELESLRLWNCRLQGPLPVEISKLTNLKNLTLSYNNLGPSLPEELRNLSKLRSLVCGGCQLSGRIPSWLGDLKELDFLELTYNSLSGEIPVEIFSLPKLTKLELYCNALTGQIPPEVGKLTFLTDLDLSNNFLTGSIPEELFSIPGLALIHLWNNSLTGPIPRGIANLTALYDVALFQNQLTGELPPDLGSKCSLQIFDVSTNNLSGSIPANLCNGGKLWRFILFRNRFTGGIPAAYGSCESLIRVRLFGNGFTGEVPPALWGKPNMVILDVSDNQLVGSVSENIGQSVGLEALRVFGNQLTGPLPRNIGRLKRLNQFIASANQLSGRLPGELGACSNLSNLLLDGNRFEGEIPFEVGQLQKLQYLSLARNSFSGSIPRDIGELFNLISLDLSENQLSGSIPPELGKLRLSEFTHFNVSYNHLTGAVPFDVNNAVFGSSFIGNPGLCVNNECRTVSERRKKSSPNVFAWTAGLVLGVAALASFGASCWFYHKYKSLVRRDDLEFGSGRGGDVWTMTPFQKLNFTEHDILESLDEDNVIGCGGAGKVYKCSLKNGQSLAVKRLWSTGSSKPEFSSRRGYSSDYGFRAEIESLGRIRHMNVVRLLCCCSNGETNILVYDYVSNGSLGDLLHGSKGSVLDWSARYKIALGAAQGLSYLHHDCVPQILHRDVKSNNILLSEDFDGMLADFGLARLREAPEDDGYSVSMLTGSLGYIAPEYAHKLKVNEKSDIYSYGVVLLELLTGRRPVDSSFGEEGTDIVRWVCDKIQSREDVMNVFDSRIVGATPRALMLALKIALHCTSEVPAHRPSMREVVRMLKEVNSGDENVSDKKTIQ